MAIPRILIVSDDRSFSTAVSRTLVSLGYQVFVADGEIGAWDLFKEKSYAMFIVDLHEQGTAGLEFVDRLRLQQADVACILVTDSSFALEQDAASRKEIRHILAKPVDMDELIDAVEEVLCSDSLKFDQMYSGDVGADVGADVTEGQMVRGDRPVWCEVCGYSTHWYHKGLMRYFCSDTCLERHQKSAGSA